MLALQGALHPFEKQLHLPAIAVEYADKVRIDIGAISRAGTFCPPAGISPQKVLSSQSWCAIDAENRAERSGMSRFLSALWRQIQEASGNKEIGKINQSRENPT